MSSTSTIFEMRLLINYYVQNTKRIQAKHGFKPDLRFTDAFIFSVIHNIIAPDLLQQASKLLSDDIGCRFILPYLQKTSKLSQSILERKIDADSVNYRRIPI